MNTFLSLIAGCLLSWTAVLSVSSSQVYPLLYVTLEHCKLLLSSSLNVACSSQDLKLPITNFFSDGQKLTSNCLDLLSSCTCIVSRPENVVDMCTILADTHHL